MGFFQLPEISFFCLSAKDLVKQSQRLLVRAQSGLMFQRVSFLFLLSAHLQRICCGCCQPLIFHHYWPRHSCLSHAEAPPSLWHRSLSNLQSLQVLAFLSFHLTVFIYYFHARGGIVSFTCSFRPIFLPSCVSKLFERITLCVYSSF